MLFTPEDRRNGYVRPFVITLLCAVASLVGYVIFWMLLRRENAWREGVVRGWSHEERAREERDGDMPVPLTKAMRAGRILGLNRLIRILGSSEERTGDEKITFRYGL